jgi:hypothetical protein
VRVFDAQNAICDGLIALSWRRYMCAIWILGVELRRLYADEMSDGETSLAVATLNVVRDVGASGNSARRRLQAADLAAQWGQVITEGEQRASGGLLNAWMTFEGAAGEMAGEFSHFYAADWVVGAAVRRWREPNSRGLRRVDRDEEIADDSPMAQTLARFELIVSGVANASESELDPATLQARILGD